MGKHTNRTEPGDYETGYCRPPEHTRFPNQITRPRQSKTPPRAIATRQFMRDFFGALEAPITVTRNGKKTRMPATSTIHEQLVAKAAKGEPWAIRRVIDLQLSLIREYESSQLEMEQMVREIEDLAKTKKLSPEAQSILDELRRRTTDPKELFDEGIRPPRRRR